MTYAIAGIVGVLFAFLGFATECVAGNIVHVANGREPNAGFALFPSIPVIPAFFAGLAWGLDQWREGVGLWIVVGLFVVYVPFWWRELAGLNQELKSALAQGEESSP